jgi:hypothetical protein
MVEPDATQQGGARALQVRITKGHHQRGSPSLIQSQSVEWRIKAK